MLTEKHIRGLMGLQHLLANVGSPGQADKLSAPDLVKAMVNPPNQINPTLPSSTGVQTPLQNPPPPVQNQSNPQSDIDQINNRSDLTADQKVKIIKALQLQQQKEANNTMYNLNPDGTQKTQ